MIFALTKHLIHHEVNDRLLFSAYNNSTLEKEAMIATLGRCLVIIVFICWKPTRKSVDKMKVLSRTVVNICFENSIGDGYTTEKLFHSKMMGASPYTGATQHIELTLMTKMYTMSKSHSS